MKRLFLLLLFAVPILLNAQVTDVQIVNSLLGKKFFEANTILDSLGVWHYMHTPTKINQDTKIMSIENGKGSTKVYTLRLNEFTIEKIIINFRHDDRKQVEDALSITGASGYHVGKYSTDIDFVFKD